jgi:hypothetical protein
VELLLKHGADVNARLTNGWTALHRAVERNRGDLAGLLVGKGADVNARGSMPKRGPVLGERRAKGTLVSGVTPASRPAAAGFADGSFVMTLDDAARPGYGNDLGLGTLYPTGEVTPLHVAVATQNLHLAQFLLEHGADVNARDATDRTPLHYAVNRRDLELIRLLLDAKADPDAKDSAGQTPLAMVAGRKDLGIMGNNFSGRTGVLTAQASEMVALLRQRGAIEVAESGPAPTVSEARVTPARLPTVGVARVLGAVKRPGTVALGLGPRKDIIDAIAECGGFTENARSQLEFTRGGVTRQFTLDELKAEADPAKKLWLEPGDTIEVKPRVW